MLPLNTSKVVITTSTGPSNFDLHVAADDGAFMSITLLPWRVTLPLTMAVVGGPVLGWRHQRATSSAHCVSTAFGHRINNGQSPR